MDTRETHLLPGEDVFKSLKLHYVVLMMVQQFNIQFSFTFLTVLADPSAGYTHLSLPLENADIIAPVTKMRLNIV